MIETQSQSPRRQSPAPAISRYVPVDVCRGLVTCLVVAHHAVLAYHPFAPKPADSLLGTYQWWRAFPVVDPQRSGAFTLLVGWNDIFFMSLMFFLSGLFVWPSLDRKGTRQFLVDRLRRLGIPFLISIAFLSPLAYYPSYLQSGRQTGFLETWMSLGSWPTGPAWFLPVLLAFDAAAAGLKKVWPRWGEVLGRRLSCFARSPLQIFALIASISLLAYGGTSRFIAAEHWTAWGPITFQTSRLLHYAVWFFAGAGIGALGPEKGLLMRYGRLSGKWIGWLLGAAGCFVITTALVIASFSPGVPTRLLQNLATLSFPFACATSCFAVLAFCVRFFQRRNKLTGILAANAYGIYLLHYPLVTFAQYFLLQVDVQPAFKGLLVFGIAIICALPLTVMLRRSTFVRHIL